MIIGKNHSAPTSRSARIYLMRPWKHLTNLLLAMLLAASASTVTAGGDINITALGGESGNPDPKSPEEEFSGGDINIQGSDLTAGNDIKLQAGNNLTIKSAENRYSSSSKNKSSSASVGVSINLGSGGFMPTLDLAASKGKGMD